MCTNTSFPPSSQTTKPNPFSGLNHFTVPSISTAVAGSGRPRRSDDGRGEGRAGGRGVPPGLASTESTAVTWRPFCPCPTCTLSLVSGSTAFVSGRLQHGNVEKRVAGAVGQLNEPEALVRSEPLDDGINGWAAGGGTLSRRSLE